MANAWGDSFFPPNQLVDFYGRLTGPKRLEFRPGDHVIAELTGIFGLDNEVWTGVHRWFDQYLAGVDTGITTEPPVLIRPYNAAAEGYPAGTRWPRPPAATGWAGSARWTAPACSAARPAPAGAKPSPPT
jgi:hypothetical protein